MKKGIIFDLDGTLLNTLDDIADSCNTALKQFGFPIHHTEQYRYYVGNGSKNLIRAAVNQPLEEHILDALHKCYSQTYNDNCMNKTVPYDGILPMLNELKQLKLKIGILTNKPHAVTQKLIDTNFKLKGYESA